jgi:hypothetical protein
LPHHRAKTAHDSNYQPTIGEEAPCYSGPHYSRSAVAETMAAKTADALVAKLRRDINSLSDENRGARRRALKNLETALLGKGKPKPKVLTECVNLHLVEPLAAVLSDPVESSREACCNLLIKLVDDSGGLRDAYPTLRACLPVLVKRVGKLPFEESAEEVRMLFVQLLHSLLKAKSCRKAKRPKQSEDEGDDLGMPTSGASVPAGLVAASASSDASSLVPATTTTTSTTSTTTSGGKRPRVKLPSPLEPHLGDVCVVLSALLRDNFPDVKRAAAAAVDEITGLFPQHMHLHLNLFVGPLLDNLQHAQHRVRRSALACLGRLVVCGSEDLPKTLREQVVPALYHVLDDHTPSVRKEQVAVLVSWLRARHECLPGELELQSVVFSMLLGAVGDDTDEVAQCAIAGIEEVARTWYHLADGGDDAGGAAHAATAATTTAADTRTTTSSAEQPEDLKVAAAAAAASARAVAAVDRVITGGAGGGGGGSGLPTTAPSQSQLLDTAAWADANASSSLLTPENVPKPFRALPSLAAQRLVCELMPSVLPPVLLALSDWKVSRRLATVAMLRAVFVFGHRELTAHLPDVLTAMVLQVCDDEKTIAEALCSCGETLGGCVEPEAVLAILLPWVRCEFRVGQPVQAQKNTLLMLASCVDGMPEGAVVPHLEVLARTLCHPAVTACEDGDVQFQVSECLARTMCGLIGWWWAMAIVEERNSSVQEGEEQEEIVVVSACGRGLLILVVMVLVSRRASGPA